MSCECCDGEGQNYECINCLKNVGEDCMRECEQCGERMCVWCHEDNTVCTPCRNATC